MPMGMPKTSKKARGGNVRNVTRPSDRQLASGGSPQPEPVSGREVVAAGLGAAAGALIGSLIGHQVGRNNPDPSAAGKALSQLAKAKKSGSSKG